MSRRLAARYSGGVDDGRTGLSGPWLASRLGIDPVALEARRRGLEIYAYRPPGSSDWIYPARQFDEEWRLRPEVESVLAAARKSGLTPARLTELLDRRVGLSGGETALDLLRQGDDRSLLSALRS